MSYNFYFVTNGVRYVASSDVGKNVLISTDVLPTPSYARISNNYGTSWSNLTALGTGFWLAEGISTNGLEIAIKDMSSGLFYFSHNGGSTFPNTYVNGSTSGYAVNESGRDMFHTKETPQQLTISHDYGVSWNLVTGTPINGGEYRSVSIDSTGQKIVIAGIATAFSANSFHTSTNGGDTWTTRKPTPAGYYPYTAMCASSDGNIIYVAATVSGCGCFYKSTNSGASWAQIGTSWSNVSQSISKAKCSSNGKNVMVVAQLSGFPVTFISVDSGLTWDTPTLSPPATITDNINFGFVNKYGSIMYAVTTNNQLYKLSRTPVSANSATIINWWN